MQTSALYTNKLHTYIQQCFGMNIVILSSISGQRPSTQACSSTSDQCRRFKRRPRQTSLPVAPATRPHRQKDRASGLRSHRVARRARRGRRKNGADDPRPSRIGRRVRIHRMEGEMNPHSFCRWSPHRIWMG